MGEDPPHCHHLPLHHPLPLPLLGGSSQHPPPLLLSHSSIGLSEAILVEALMRRTLKAAMVHTSDNTWSKPRSPKKPLRVDHLRQQMVRLVEGARGRRSQRSHPPNPKVVRASDAVQGVPRLLRRNVGSSSDARTHCSHSPLLHCRTRPYFRGHLAPATCSWSFLELART